MFLPAAKSSIAKHRKYRPDITDDFCNKAATMSTQLNFIDEKVKKNNHWRRHKNKHKLSYNKTDRDAKIKATMYSAKIYRD